MELRITYSLFLLFIPTPCLQVLQITDFHLDPDYSLNGDKTKMCHQSNAIPTKDPNKLGKFGDYMCDSPQDLVSYAVSEAARLFPSPDLILWTGDNTPHVDGYDMKYVLSGISKTTSILFSAFPNTTILPTFGNHDYAPANDFDEQSSLYHSVYYNMWKEQVGTEDQDNFLRGGFYSHSLPNTDAKILVLNTNLYYGYNKAYDNFTDRMDPAGQFKYMERVLGQAEDCERVRERRRGAEMECVSTVHIVAHIGPGAFERTPNITWFRPEYNDRFLSIINRYQKQIKWLIFGHHHTDTFHVVRDEIGNPINIAWMSPAVTPWFSDLAGAGSNNPTFRVYDIDDKTGEIKDFVTYVINLDTLNSEGKSEAVVEYSMKEAFSLPSLSSSDVSPLIDRMSSNDSLFMKYITYNSAGWNVKMPKGEFRQAQLCSLSYADYPRYFSCMESTKYLEDITTTTTTTNTKVEKVEGILSLILFASLFLL